MANEAPAVTLVVHPPERGRRRAGVPAQAGPGCTCCCCCCLHSVGSLIGAAVAPNLGRQRAYLALIEQWEEEELPSPEALPDADRDAITTERPPAPPAAAPASDAPFARRDIVLPHVGPSAVKLFWWSLLVLLVLALVALVVHSGTEGLVVGGIVILLVLPAGQLLAAIVAAAILAATDRVDKRYQYWQLAKIAAGVVVGTVVGILLMVGIYFLFPH
jgi:hypothetical protein